MIINLVIRCAVVMFTRDLNGDFVNGNITLIVVVWQEVHGLFLDYFLHSSTLVNNEELTAPDWDPCPRPPQEKCCVTIDVKTKAKVDSFSNFVTPRNGWMSGGCWWAMPRKSVIFPCGSSIILKHYSTP